MLTNQRFNFVQVAAAKTVIRHQAHRIEPELCLMLRGLHMNMRRFVPFVAEEEEAKSTRSQHRGHEGIPSLSPWYRFKSQADVPSPSCAHCNEPLAATVGRFTQDAKVPV